MKSITRIELTNDHVVLRYVDDQDMRIDERAIIVRWKTHETIRKVVNAFQEAVGNYLLTSNKSLDDVLETDLESLFKNLLKENETLEP